MMLNKKNDICRVFLGHNQSNQLRSYSGCKKTVIRSSLQQLVNVTLVTDEVQKLEAQKVVLSGYCHLKHGHEH